jgi:hypothetical protein
MSRLYLAYGSNMSREQMRARCPGALLLDAVVIPGWRLAFRGEFSRNWGSGAVATLLPEPTACAPGIVYDLQPEHEAALDGWEGVAQGHYAKHEEFGRYHGRPLYTYISNAGVAGEPGRAYLGIMRQGFHDWKLLIDPLCPLALAQGAEQSQVRRPC